MYGWRGRVGCYYPAVVAENIFTTFFKLVPEGVTLALKTGNEVQDLAGYNVERIHKEMIEMIDIVAQRKVDIIIIAAAPVANALGWKAEAELLASLTQRTGIEVMTTQSAAVAAMERLGVSRLAVATCYDDERNVAMAKYLESRNLHISNIGGLNRKIVNMHDVPTSIVYHHVRETLSKADRPEAIYIPTMQFPIPDVAMLEDDFGLPVIYAGHAMVWYAMRYLKIHDQKFNSCGALLRTLAPDQH